MLNVLNATGNKTIEFSIQQKPLTKIRQIILANYIDKSAFYNDKFLYGFVCNVLFDDIVV